MTKGRSVTLSVRYNNASLDEQVVDIESLTYTDEAADNSDSIDITVDARDEKWLNSWMPEMGASLVPQILGENWESEGDSRSIPCGSFTVDSLDYSQAPDTMILGGVSKPGDSDFSETERETVWKNTSIRRIGQTIADRYGLGFSYDAPDHDIGCDEQDGPDSSYYNDLCKRYGFVLKVYANRLWVYDREEYKRKRAVKTFRREDMEPGSFRFTTTLCGTYTGGHFSYTDPDTDRDIEVSIGGGKRIKEISRRAESEADALLQLCAELNNDNHGSATIRFTTDGEWGVSASDCIALSGFGKLDGKYFVDRVTHQVSASGLTSQLEASLVTEGFRPGQTGSGMEPEGAMAQGTAIRLERAPGYVSSDAKSRACTLTGNYWLYDGELIRGRYRVTNTASRCGKKPVGKNVTAWVNAGDCEVIE